MEGKNNRGYRVQTVTFTRKYNLGAFNSVDMSLTLEAEVGESTSAKELLLSAAREVESALMTYERGTKHKGER